jgi:aldose 1-epimerase
MDFTAFHKIGERINADYQQSILAGGYDHTFVVSDYDKSLRLTAEAICEGSGIKLQIFTTAPGVVFYAGNFLDGTINGKNGIAYGKRSGFCLETQRFPDSPNKPHFPSTLLRPEEIYHQKTVYKFLF